MKLSERKLVGLELVSETEEKVFVICSDLKAAQGCQKTYLDLKREEISFEDGNKVFLKVSHWKKIIRFSQKGNLSPRFLGPYEVLKKVRPVAYRLALPPKLSKIHNVFQVSMLRRYRLNTDHVVKIEELEVKPILSYEEELVSILAREVKELRNKRIPSVKVLWRNHSTKEATWEREKQMRE